MATAEERAAADELVALTEELGLYETDKIVNTQWYPANAENIEAAIGQAVGAGSVCWESMAGTGVFQDDRARAVVDGLLKWINDHNVVSPRGSYTTEVGGVTFSQAQWEAAQVWSRGTDAAVDYGFDEPGEPLR